MDVAEARPALPSPYSIHPHSVQRKHLGWQEKLAVMWVEIDFMEPHGQGKHRAVSCLPSDSVKLDACRAWGC